MTDKYEDMLENISPSLWVAEFVSTIQNAHGDKVDMYRLNGEGNTLCTLGVPHGNKAIAKQLVNCKNHNQALVQALEVTLRDIKSLEAINPMLDFQRDYAKEIKTLAAAKEIDNE